MSHVPHRRTPRCRCPLLLSNIQPRHLLQHQHLPGRHQAPRLPRNLHDTDASDDEYWAKKQKQSKPKPSTQTFVTGTAVTKNKKSGSIRDYDKVRKLAPVLFHSLRYSNTLTRIVMPTSLRPSQDSKLYTVLFESGERKTFKENQIRKMLTSKGEKVSEEDLADMEVEESDKAESDEEFGEGEQDISAGSRSLRTASPSF